MAFRCTFLVLVAVLTATPLCANSVTFARQHEARAAMGAIRDKLLKLYEENGNRIDPEWSIERNFSEELLSGSYLKKADFVISFPAESPDSVRIECTRAYVQRNGPMVLVTNLRTRADQWIEPPPDEGKDVSKALVTVMFGCALLIVPLMVLARVRRKPSMGMQNRVALTLAASGLWFLLCLYCLGFLFVAVSNSWEETPRYWPTIMSGVAICGVAMFFLGTFFVKSEDSVSFIAHLVSAIIAGLVAAFAATSTSTYQSYSVLIGVGAVVLVIAISALRFSRATR